MGFQISHEFYKVRFFASRLYGFMLKELCMDYSNTSLDEFC